MKKCPFCGADIEDSARFCLYCMQSLTEKEQILPPKRKRSKRWLLIVAVAIIILLVLAVIYFKKNTATGDGASTDTQPITGSSITEPSTTEPSTTESTTTIPSTTAPQTTAPPHTHSYNMANAADKYRKSEATCLIPAVYYYSCSCGEKGSETFSYGSLKEHVSVIDKGYSPGCTTKGLTDGAHCSVCNTILVQQQSIAASGHSNDPSDPLSVCPACGEMPLHVHDFSEKNTDVKYRRTPATCLSAATNYYSCVCGATGSKFFYYGPLGDHFIITDSGYPASCSTPGRTSQTYCADCKEVYDAYEEIPQLGHTYNLGDESPECIFCQKEGSVVVISNLPQHMNNGAVAVSCTFTVKPLSEETMELNFRVNILNPTTETIPITDCLKGSVYVFKLDIWISADPLTFNAELKPNESCDYELQACVPIIDSTYALNLE